MISPRLALNYFVLNCPKPCRTAPHDGLPALPALPTLPSGIGVIFCPSIFSFSNRSLKKPRNDGAQKNASATAGFEILLAACLASTTLHLLFDARSERQPIASARSPCSRPALLKLGRAATLGFNAGHVGHRRACLCVFLDVYSVM